MSWAKADFVNQAFEEIGFASYVYDSNPDQLQSCLRRMDGLLATWNAKGIHLGYPLPSGANVSALTDVTGVSDAAAPAIYLNLACQIAPMFGKQLSPQTVANARDAYEALLTKIYEIPEMSLGAHMPSGAGHKTTLTTGRVFIPERKEPINIGNGNELSL